jgi:hypothetical protein
MSWDRNVGNWTYGAEHEWADWDTTRPLPPGYGRDRKDITIVNSTGVANDPKDRLHQRGGEINTPPTSTIEGQMACMRELQELYPEATINYRSNLHLHIRVPGLRDDLETLKRVQTHIHEWMPKALPVIEPLVLPKIEAQEKMPGYTQGWKRRLRRMRASHQTLLKPDRVARQLAAETVEDFFRAEAPCSQAGVPQMHLQPRLSVNVRQLRETDTIEFRHFPGTMDPELLSMAFTWCEGYLIRALQGEPVQDLIDNMAAHYPNGIIPFQPYDHWLEERYRRTVHDGTIPKDQLPLNIAAVLKERRP